MSGAWYILDDGSVADPADVEADASGVLHHKDGRAVAYKPHGPRARMVSAEEAEAYCTRDMKAEEHPEEEESFERVVGPGSPFPRSEDASEEAPVKPKRRYKTRMMKAKD